MRGIDLHIRRANVLVFVECLREGLAAVGGKEHAAFLIRPVGMSGDRNQHALRVLGIDRQGRYLLAIAQPEMRPGLAGIR